MKFTTITVASTAAALAAASPCKPSPATPATPAQSGSSNPFNNGAVFHLVAQQEGHFNDDLIQADFKKLRIDTTQQANCTNTKGQRIAINYASLQIIDGKLSLYTGDENSDQTFFTDRSGMGQGVLQYTSGPTNGRSFETQGFTINQNGNLVFDTGRGPISPLTACPNGSYGYNIWFDVTENPAGQEGCISFSAHAVAEDENDLITCSYTEEQSM